MFVILLFKFLSVEYFDCPRIRQPIHQRNIVINFKEITSQDGKIFGSTKKGKVGLSLVTFGLTPQMETTLSTFFKVWISL